MAADRAPVIVGVAESDLGVTGKSILELQTQAITAALAEAGLALIDVDGLATNGIAGFPATMVAEYLGIFPTWMDSTAAGGSSYEIFTPTPRAIEPVSPVDGAKAPDPRRAPGSWQSVFMPDDTRHESEWRSTL